jgi:hypothetical protein
MGLRGGEGVVSKNGGKVLKLRRIYELRRDGVGHVYEMSCPPHVMWGVSAAAAHAARQQEV